eukprot:1402488-Rhodomonas_salina.1
MADGTSKDGASAPCQLASLFHQPPPSAGPAINVGNLPWQELANSAVIGFVWPRERFLAGRALSTFFRDTLSASVPVVSLRNTTERNQSNDPVHWTHVLHRHVYGLLRAIAPVPDKRIVFVYPPEAQTGELSRLSQPQTPAPRLRLDTFVNALSETLQEHKGYGATITQLTLSGGKDARFFGRQAEGHVLRTIIHRCTNMQKLSLMYLRLSGTALAEPALHQEIAHFMTRLTTLEIGYSGGGQTGAIVSTSITELSLSDGVSINNCGDISEPLAVWALPAVRSLSLNSAHFDRSRRGHITEFLDSSGMTSLTSLCVTNVVDYFNPDALATRLATLNLFHYVGENGYSMAETLVQALAAAAVIGNTSLTSIALADHHVIEGGLWEVAVSALASMHNLQELNLARCLKKTFRNVWMKTLAAYTTSESFPKLCSLDLSDTIVDGRNIPQFRNFLTKCTQLRIVKLGAIGPEVTPAHMQTLEAVATDFTRRNRELAQGDPAITISHFSYTASGGGPERVTGFTLVPLKEQHWAVT